MKLFSKKQDDLFFLVDEDENNSISTGEVLPEPTHALTPEEVLSTKIDTSKRYDGASALDSLKKRMLKATEKDERTLLEKCKPFIVDQEGKDTSINTEPTYTLESVDQILKSDDQKIIDQLAHKYDISFDYLGKYVEQKTEKTVEETELEIAEETPIVEKEEFEDKIKINVPIKNVQSSVPFIISDIDDDSSIPQKDQPDISSTTTITFTPVTSQDAAQPKMVVSTHTRAIDLTGEFEHISSNSDTKEENNVMLESNDFEDFVPRTEFKTEADGKKTNPLL